MHLHTMGQHRQSQQGSYGQQELRQSSGSTGRRLSWGQAAPRLSWGWAKTSTTDTAGTCSQEAGPKPARTGLFSQVRSLQNQLHEHMGDKPYDVADFYYTQGISQQIARSKSFEHLTMAIISLNAIWLAIDADWNNAESPLDAEAVFIIADNLVCFYFFGELAIRFAAFAEKLNCLRDAWFVFDSVLVILMVLETWVVVIFLLASSNGKASDFSGLGVLRMVRVVRITRMARIARLLRMVPEFVILVKGMFAAMRSVFFTLSLLCVFLYAFAICLSEMTSESTVGETYFPMVHVAMLSLLTHCIFFDEIGTFINDIANGSPEVLPLIFLILLITSLTLMNMLIGVLVEVVQAVAATEKEALTIENVRMKLTEIMETSGLPSHHGITQAQFCELLRSQRIAQLLSRMEVDADSLVGLADFIFAELEPDPEGSRAAAEFHGFEDKTEQVLPFSDFMELLLTMRKSNSATVKNIVDLQKFMGKQLTYIEALLEHREKKFEKRISMLSPLTHSSSMSVKDPHYTSSGFTGSDSMRHSLSRAKSNDTLRTSGSNEYPEPVSSEASKIDQSYTMVMTAAASSAVEREISLKNTAAVQLMEERLQTLDVTLKQLCDSMSMSNLSAKGIVSNLSLDTEASPPSDFHGQMEVLQADLKQLSSIHEYCIAGCCTAPGESLGSKLRGNNGNEKLASEKIKESLSPVVTLGAKQHLRL